MFFQTAEKKIIMKRKKILNQSKYTDKHMIIFYQNWKCIVRKSEQKSLRLSEMERGYFSCPNTRWIIIYLTKMISSFVMGYADNPIFEIWSQVNLCLTKKSPWKGKFTLQIRFFNWICCTDTIFKQTLRNFSKANNAS
jgi:hypothetical protein